MKRAILTLLLSDSSKINAHVIADVLKALGIKVEETYHMGTDRDKHTVLLEYIIESWIEQELEKMGHAATIERVDYIMNDLMTGDKFNEPIIDMLKGYVSNAVSDRRIELEGFKSA